MQTQDNSVTKIGRADAWRLTVLSRTQDFDELSSGEVDLFLTKFSQTGGRARCSISSPCR